MAGIASGICTLAIGGGDSRRRQPQAQATLNSNTNTDTNTNTNTDTNTNSNTCPTPTYDEAAYVNSAKQNIKGLTNQTGYVKGNANGVINFGTLTASAGAHRQP